MKPPTGGPTIGPIEGRHQHPGHRLLTIWRFLNALRNSSGPADRDHHGPAHALQEAPDDQEKHVGREGARGRTGGEEMMARQEHAGGRRSGRQASRWRE